MSSASGSPRVLLTEIGCASTGDELITLAAARRFAAFGAVVTVLHRVSLADIFERAGVSVEHIGFPLRRRFDDVTTAAELVAAYQQADPEGADALRGIVDRHELVFVAPGGKFTEGFNIPRALVASAMALDRGKPVGVLHQSIGPIETPTHRALLADVFTRASMILVRDEVSLAYLRDLGVPEKKLTQTADVAFAETFPAPPEPDVDLGVNLRFSKLGHLDESVVVRFLVDYLQTRPGHHVLFYSTTTAIPAVFRRAVEAMGATVATANPSWPDYLALPGRCRLNISDSFHGIILSMMAGRPVIPLQTDLRTWKVAGLTPAGKRPLRIFRGFEDDDARVELSVEVERLEADPTPLLRQQRRIVRRNRQLAIDGWVAVHRAVQNVRSAAAPVGRRPHRDRTSFARLKVNPPEFGTEIVRCSADFERPGHLPLILWFDVPIEWAAAVTDRADPFVIASLMSAAQRKVDLRIEGAPTTRPLLAGLSRFLDVWHAWRGYRQITIESETVAERERASGPVIAAFSGGVDSAFSLYRHAREKAGLQQRDIGAALLIHGFDIPLDADSSFAAAVERARRMVESVDVPLVPVRTNLREAFPELNYQETHGTAIIAALSLLSGRFGAGLVAASSTYDLPFIIWGSNPLTDPMLGSRDFEIIHDGASAGRLDKVRALAQWPEAIGNLRVCWQNGNGGGNCGRCAKCILTALEFRCVGVDPTCFETPVTNDAITSLLQNYRTDPFGDVAFREVLAAAEASGVTEPWVADLGQTIEALA